MRTIAGLVLAAGLAGAVSAQEPNPVGEFLHAADVNDYDAMRLVMTDHALEAGRGEISLNRFFDKIEDCYLRRVYSAPEEGRFVATWMCAEGNSRSRVVIGDVRLTDEGVQVGISLEQRNPRPAPERTGSAFADEAE